MITKERISKIVEKWYLQEPLYFQVWSLHEVKPLIQIKTIRVKNGAVEFNPDFINSLTDKQLEEVLSFEAMRIVLKHPYSRKKDNASKAYLASNITIQEYLKTQNLGFVSAQVYFRTDKFNSRYYEFYYNKILELESDLLDQGENTATDTATDTDTDILLTYSSENEVSFENAIGWDRSEYLEQLVNDKIIEAQLSSSWGGISGNMQEKIIASLKPKINYKSILKSFRASILSSNRRLTRMKPSRRYGFLYMGSRRDFTTKLLFAVDTSGSVSSVALKVAFSILNRFFKYGIEEISVICFDTEIKGELMTFKKAKKDIQIFGRGGTNFSAVTNFIDLKREYDGVIIFTDGYAPCPPRPKNIKTRILWLFDSEHNCNHNRENLSKLGRVAFVKES